MKLIEQMLEQASIYFDAKEYKLSIKQLNKTKKLIKRLRRKSK